ncbi:hypothetical protein SCHPADRAFT_665939 [Schizopora paradoxa]|uniref:Uncharacterized protein n=1 Tax=Schizopora paradoxa TaxID=27342 RepID=A0A0H2RC60_9AGAM|nr:hypothetical protein SCHPADRAFT_665939 [Schizopora paradoxa]
MCVWDALAAMRLSRRGSSRIFNHTEARALQIWRTTVKQWIHHGHEHPRQSRSYEVKNRASEVVYSSSGPVFLSASATVDLLVNTWNNAYRKALSSCIVDLVSKAQNQWHLHRRNSRIPIAR